MTQEQSTHPIYELKVDVSNTSRLFEYYMLKDFISEHDTVLDIGCNTGTGMDILATFCKTVHGIDVVPELSNVLGEKYRNHKQITFEIVKEGELPKTEMRYDVVVANNFIEHVADPNFYVRKFHEILKPGGRLFLTTVNRKNRLYFWQRPYNRHHYTEYSRRSLELLVKGHFNDVVCKGIVKKTPFFPDYLKEAPSRKFNMGIKFPVLDFLKLLKRILLRRKQAESPLLKTVNVAHLATEKFHLPDFMESFNYIAVDSENPKKWIELFVICIK